LEVDKPDVEQSVISFLFRLELPLPCDIDHSRDQIPPFADNGRRHEEVLYSDCLYPMKSQISPPVQFLNLKQLVIKTHQRAPKSAITMKLLNK